MLTSKQLRTYHEGMDFESAWRSYAGMIELKEMTEDGQLVTLERLRLVIPSNIYAELENYFRVPEAMRLDGDYE